MRRFGGGRLSGWFLGPLVGLLVGLAVALGGCAHSHQSADSAEPPPPSPMDADINQPPVNYRADIAAAMRAYLSDPTGIRDAGISEPLLRGIAGHPRYVVCVRYNAKKFGSQRGQYGGVKELAAVFMVGKFDRFVEAGRAHDKPQDEAAAEQNPPEQKAPGLCGGVAYGPFPELQKLNQ
jgi:hypothetical protein